MATTQDPIEQALEKLGEFGIPVEALGARAKGLMAQAGSIDPGEMVEQIGAIDLKQLDIGEMLGELKDRVDALDPALRVPIMAVAGFAAARVIRWIIR